MFKPQINLSKTNILMSRGVHNNLIDGYNSFKTQSNPFKNNNLLSNKMVQNNLIYSQKTQTMMNIQKTNEQSNIENKNLIYQSIISPIIIRKDDKERINTFNIRLHEREQQNNIDKTDCWKKRTNQPYKKILKKENYNKKFENAADLIVYKVTDIDKITGESELKTLINTLEKHNNELKTIYSASEELNYKKKFEYNHVEKFRIKYDAKKDTEFDHKNLKKNKIEYYKQEQLNIEKDKKKIDTIIESLLNNNLLDGDDIRKIEKMDVSDNINEDVKNKYKNRQKL